MSGCSLPSYPKVKKHDERLGRCLLCGKRAAVLLPYGPQRFCEYHFMRLVEKRVKRTVRHHKLIKPRERIAIALSGGKDSTFLFHIIHKFFCHSNELIAILVDEGIKGYRDKALRVAKKNCKALGVDHRYVSFKEIFGMTMKRIASFLTKKENMSKYGSPCTFCGVLRRRALNIAAKQELADKLATGHNLDDEVQSILMNIFDNDLEKYVRLGPKTGIVRIEKFVPRIKPIVEIPEREVILYDTFAGIEYYGGECCPFSSYAKRNEFRVMVEQFEQRFPGTRYSIYRFFLRSRELMLPAVLRTEDSRVRACKRCGEPTRADMCRVCQLLEKLREDMKK
jgi:uncharacterized protein (TIGR00269 family)